MPEHLYKKTSSLTTSFKVPHHKVFWIFFRFYSIKMLTFRKILKKNQGNPPGAPKEPSTAIFRSLKIGALRKMGIRIHYYVLDSV